MTSYPRLFRQVQNFPGGLDTFTYVAAYGPLTPDDIENINVEQANRLGVSPTLNGRTISTSLDRLKVMRLVVDDGAQLWQATRSGVAFDRWLTGG